MLLSELLRADLIKAPLEAENKREAIRELVDVLVQQHDIPMIRRSDVIEAVFEHESSMGTGMEKGIAIPHASTSHVEDTLCVLGIAPQGIPFDSLDGQPARLVILLVVPKKQYADKVQTLAGIAHLLEKDDVRERIINEKSPEAILDYLEQKERARA